jgi:hypothetical protein
MMGTNVGGMHVVNFVATSWTSKLVRLLVLLVLHYNFFSLCCPCHWFVFGF